VSEPSQTRLLVRGLDRTPTKVSVREYRHLTFQSAPFDSTWRRRKMPRTFKILPGPLFCVPGRLSAKGTQHVSGYIRCLCVSTVAKEAMRDSIEAVSQDERRALEELACTWAQAALMSDRIELAWPTASEI
jgi:hypothetical protein